MLLQVSPVSICLVQHVGKVVQVFVLTQLCCWSVAVMSEAISSDCSSLSSYRPLRKTQLRWTEWNRAGIMNNRLTLTWDQSFMCASVQAHECVTEPRWSRTPVSFEGDHALQPSCAKTQLTFPRSGKESTQCVTVLVWSPETFAVRFTLGIRYFYCRQAIFFTYARQQLKFKRYVCGLLCGHKWRLGYDIEHFMTLKCNGSNRYSDALFII